MALKINMEELIKTMKLTFLGVRHFQMMMFFVGVTINLSIRVSMSIAIVDMTDNTKDGFFSWTIKTQSVILSSFFWGYIVLQVPAGELSAKYGGKRLFLACVAGNSCIQLLIPLAACGGWEVVCACRVLQGLLQGFMLPSVHSLMAKWVPSTEISSMGMFIYSGCPFGLALQLLISGFIAHAWGWAAIFYIGGSAGLVWSLLYYLFGADSPQSSSIIGEEERKFIQESLGQSNEKHKKYPTPWKAMFTSPPFIALIIAHIGFSWGMWTLMSEIPTYVRKVLGVNIKDNGILSALPYVTMTLMGLPFGYLSQCLLRHKLMSVGGTRKLSNSISFFGAAISMIAVSHAGTNITVVTALLCVAVGMGAGHVTGFMLVHLDMAPNFAGTMMGITNGVSNVIAILGPITAGALLKNDGNQSEWRKLFYLTAGIYVLTNLVFVIFGTSERQAWNQPDVDPKLVYTGASSRKWSCIALVGTALLSRTIVANKFDIVIVDRSQRWAVLVDITIPHDENLLKPEKDKISKYLDLALEITAM